MMRPSLQPTCLLNKYDREVEPLPVYTATTCHKNRDSGKMDHRCVSTTHKRWTCSMKVMDWKDLDQNHWLLKHGIQEPQTNLHHDKIKIQTKIRIVVKHGGSGRWWSRFCSLPYVQRFGSTGQGFPICTSGLKGSVKNMLSQRIL